MGHFYVCAHPTKWNVRINKCGEKKCNKLTIYCNVYRFTKELYILRFAYEIDQSTSNFDDRWWVDHVVKAGGQPFGCMTILCHH